MSYFLKYEDDDCIDLSEFRKPRPRFWCSDRMCGGTDCGNCYPNQPDHSDEEEAEEQPE